ncbi:MAG TPA: translocation/assembly module TamB domain-containing protein, partial [Kofleriaceae bacterium]|nr:translocation/assembly module TamB domain-containing protein [Kofleriaceae bacterium]
QQPIALIPRGVRRELSFKRGRVEIETIDPHTYRLVIGDPDPDQRDPSASVQISIDGEGSLEGINGDLVLRDGALARLAVGLDANNIPFRIPGTLDLVLRARGVTIEKESEHASFAVSGKIEIIDGTYRRNIALTEQLVALGSSGPPSTPFWEEYPTLGDADLNLTLEIKRFAVVNNIANIELDAKKIQITSTPRDPRLSGQIDVGRGEFRIPGTRAKFTRTSGSIKFEANEPAGNPSLNVQSDAPDYRDLSGQNHVITLTLNGKLQQLTWDLRTSTGYDKSQTLSLLVLGRNSEQLRRSLGDQSLGADPLRADPTTNPSQGFADQIVKDLAGDWVSGLLGDSLGRMIGLDVLRIEIGFGSIGFHAEKKLLENLKLLGQTEQTIRGSTLDLRVEQKTPYGFSVEVGFLNKNFNDPAEQDIKDRGVKAVYRLFIP